MNLTKKIIIGVTTVALVVVISLAAVFAAQSFSLNATTTVTFNVGTDIQCNVWCKFLKFSSNSTFTNATLVEQIDIHGFHYDAVQQNSQVAQNVPTLNFNGDANDRNDYFWLLVLYVENLGSNNIKVSINQNPQLAKDAVNGNIKFGSFKVGQTLNKTGKSYSTYSSISDYTFTSITGAGSEVTDANMATGLTSGSVTTLIAGAETVGGIGGTIAITKLFSVGNKTVSGAKSVSWAIKLENHVNN